MSHREGMLIAESQRMKHELKILQKKISNLNLAKMANGPIVWETENGMLPTTGMGEKVAAKPMCVFLCYEKCLLFPSLYHFRSRLTS